MNNTELKGVMPALVTPLDSQGGVNETTVREMARYHLDKGSDGFYLCGSTGQGIYMTTNERKQTTEVVIDEVSGKVPVIVHVGSMVQVQAIELLKHASDAGAAAVSSIIPPSFESIEAITRYFRSLADVSDLPLLPYFRGAAYSPLQIMKELQVVPTIMGTKYTGPDMYEMTHIIQIGKDPWWVFSGMDEQCVFAAMCGATGAIGSSVNVMPGVYKKIRQLVAEGNPTEAYEYQRKANNVLAVLISYGYAGSLRAALGMLGFDCGDPRPPETPLDSSKLDALKSDLKAAGFDEVTAL